MDPFAIVSAQGLRDEFGITFSPTHIARKIKQKTFPPFFKLSEGPKALKFWWRSDIRQWLMAQAAKSRVAAPFPHNFDEDDLEGLEEQS